MLPMLPMFPMFPMRRSVSPPRKPHAPHTHSAPPPRRAPPLPVHTAESVRRACVSSQEAAIRKWVDLCCNRGDVIWWLSKLLPARLQTALLSSRLAKTYLRLASLTVEEAIRECGVTNDELYAILIGQFADYGTSIYSL